MLNKIFLLVLIFSSLFSQNRNYYDVKRINESVYIFSFVWGENARTNIGAVIHDDGVLLINTMMLNKVSLLEKELKKLTDKPVKYVLNSNWDWYNTSANKYFADKGATIISHENTVYMTQMYSQLLFKDKISLDFGREKVIAYRSYGHSFGHVNIYLPKSNIIFVGDSFSNDRVNVSGPFGMDGHIKGLKSIINLSDKETIIVSGNSSIKEFNTVNDLENEIINHKKFNVRVSELFDKGYTFKEMGEDPQITTLLSRYKKALNWRSERWVYSPVRFYNSLNSDSFDVNKFKSIIGTYKSSDGTIIEVFIRKGRFYARCLGLFYVNLVPRKEQMFWFSAENLNRYIRIIKDKLFFEFPKGEGGYLEKLRSLEFVKE